MILFLSSWVSWIANRAAFTMTILLLITACCAWIAVDRFRLNSDLGSLINQESQWREDFDRFEQQFPDLLRTGVLVVSGRSLLRVESATESLVARLSEENDLLAFVYAPRGEKFLRDHALLYLDQPALDDMADRLAQAQPMLTGIAEDPSLRSVLKLLSAAVAEGETPAGMDRIVELVSASGRNVLTGDDPVVSWTDEFFGTADTVRRLVFIKGKTNFGVTLPNEQVMLALRDIVAELDHLEDIDINITGEIALAHEEIEAAVSGVQLAGWVSVVLLFGVLLVGVRSGKIIFSTFLMLLMGVIWTSAYAMLTIGEYNTLSIVFLVMFFGLGVDFALHFSLRYQEAVNRGVTDVGAALRATASSVGGAIMLCTLTTAIAFLGFLPTSYEGLADLGTISAGGMLIAAILTFTLLPACYALGGEIKVHTIDLPTGQRLVSWLVSQRQFVVGALALLTLAAVYIALDMRFDYSVLALRDENSESMRTFRTLQTENLSNDYSLAVLTQEPLQTASIEALEVVDKVITVQQFVPEDQVDKIEVLEYLQEILWSAIEPDKAQPSPGVAELSEQIAELRERAQQSYLPEYQELAEVLSDLLSSPEESLLIWQRGVVSNLVQELKWLRRALLVDEIGFADLPVGLQSRLISEDGWHLSIVMPSADISDVKHLSKFVEGVRGELPMATGRPVIEWGVGGIVRTAFLQALGIAVIGVLVVVFLTFRSIVDTVLIAVPLLLSSVYTLAICVLIDVPLNMANVIVLPLIFGLGVDNGIHVVDRHRGVGNVEHLLHSSTPRAVMLSTLTTIGAFAALSASPHRGTASIGLLLAIAVGLLLLFTVFLLPVLLSFLPPNKSARSSGQVESAA